MPIQLVLSCKIIPALKLPWFAANLHPEETLYSTSWTETAKKRSRLTEPNCALRVTVIEKTILRLTNIYKYCDVVVFELFWDYINLRHPRKMEFTVHSRKHCANNSVSGNLFSLSSLKCL